MKKLCLMFCLFALTVTSSYAAGKADDVVRHGTRILSRELLEAGGKKADDAIRYATRNADNWARAASTRIDDVSRITVRNADNVARIGFQRGDDVIRNFSEVHGRRIAQTLGTKTDNVARVTFPKKWGNINAIPETLDGPLKNNTIYKQLGSEYQYFTKTDSLGRVKNVYAPELGRKLHSGRLANVRKGDLDHMHYNTRLGDEGGHLLADLFGGSKSYDNIVPMSSKLNHGKWSEMERQLDGFIQSGRKVTNYHVTASYPSSVSNRPSRFIVEYMVDGEKYRRIFKNLP